MMTFMSLHKHITIEVNTKECWMRKHNIGRLKGCLEALGYPDAFLPFQGADWLLIPYNKLLSLDCLGWTGRRNNSFHHQQPQPITVPSSNTTILKIGMVVRFQYSSFVKRKTMQILWIDTFMHSFLVGKIPTWYPKNILDCNNHCQIALKIIYYSR